MPQSNSLAAIMRLLAASLQEGDPRHAFVSTTTSAGTATTLIDEGLIHTDGDTAMLGRAFVRIDETVTQAFSPAVTINEGAPFSASDTTLTVNDASGIAANDVIVIESERLLVTGAPAGNNVTVTRGIDGTTAASHADGTACTRSGPIAGSVYRSRSTGLTLASGTITVETMRGHVLSGTDYSLWRVANPVSVRRLVIRLLGNKKRDVIVPVSMITDADMETTGVTNWPAVTAPSTREKSTTARFIRRGSQSLHIVASANNSGAESQDSTASLGPLTVPLRNWIAAVTLRVITGTAKIIVRDVTNSANIAPADVTSDENAWQIAFFPVIAPDDCEELRLRVLGSANGDEFYVDDAILWPTMQKEFEPPSWLEDPADIIDIGYYRPRASTGAAGSNYLYTPEESEWVPWGWEPESVDEGASHPYRVTLKTPIVYPLYMKARRPYATLSADTDTTTADAEGLVQSALWEIYDRLANENINKPDLFQRYSALRQDVGTRSFFRLLNTRELAVRPKIKGPRWSSY